MPDRDVYRVQMINKVKIERTNGREYGTMSESFRIWCCHHTYREQQNFTCKYLHITCNEYTRKSNILMESNLFLEGAVRHDEGNDYL